MMRLGLMAVLAALATASVVAGVVNALEGSHDLPWHEARLLASGANPYAHYLEGAGGAPRTGDPDTSEPVQLPSVLMLFAPLGLVELATAQRVWLALNIAATAAFLVLAVRLFAGRLSAHAAGVLALLFLASTPLRVTVGNNQYGLVAMAFLLGAFALLERRRPVAAGLLGGLALLKYTLVLPFFALFLHRPRHGALAIALALAVHVALTLLAGVVTGTDPLLLVRQSLEIAGAITTLGYFDFFAFFAWAAPGAGPALPAGCALAVIGATVALARRRPDLRYLAILSLVAIVIVYHKIYDAFVLFFLLLHLADLARRLAAPARAGRPDRGGLLELAAGALVLAYVFFADRILLALVRWQVLDHDTRVAATGAAAVAIYAYLALLFLRAWRAPRPVAAP